MPLGWAKAKAEVVDLALKRVGRIPAPPKAVLQRAYAVAMEKLPVLEERIGKLTLGSDVHVYALGA